MIEMMDLDSPCGRCGHALIAHVPDDSGERQPCAACACADWEETP